MCRPHKHQIKMLVVSRHTVFFMAFFHFFGAFLCSWMFSQGNIKSTTSDADVVVFRCLYIVIFIIFWGRWHSFEMQHALGRAFVLSFSHRFFQIELEKCQKKHVCYKWYTWKIVFFFYRRLKAQELILIANFGFILNSFMMRVSESIIALQTHSS